MKVTGEQYHYLVELSIKMHPHLGIDNHTQRLITKCMHDEPLSNQEIFDLGKYYQRMLQMIDEKDPNYGEQVSAILALKSMVYSIK